MEPIELKLEPVGEEWDGSVKPLDAIDYEPEYISPARPLSATLQTAPPSISDLEAGALENVRVLAERARNLTAEVGLLKGDEAARLDDLAALKSKAWHAGHDAGWNDACEKVGRIDPLIALAAFVLGGLVSALFCI